jgi:heme-degrading monooxygenase HmoA
MITIGMNYRVLPGKNQVFENAFAGVLKAMQEMEGHTQSHLFKGVADPNHYLIVSDWSSEDAFNGFIRSEKFAKVANWGKEQILAGRPSHQVYKR